MFRELCGVSELVFRDLPVEAIFTGELNRSSHVSHVSRRSKLENMERLAASEQGSAMSF